MEITRNVILDLLPLYLANEVSDDTRALVEEYLEIDPELAHIAEQSAVELPGDIPIPLTKEDRMEAYKKAKLHMTLRTFFLALLISFAFLCALGVLGMGLLLAYRL